MIGGMMNNTFQEWLEKVDRYAKSLGYANPSMTTDTGHECWRGYYDSGCSPEEAVNEDWSYE